MVIFQAYVVTPDDQTYSCPVLADDRTQAIALAVDRCKGRFGVGARVSRLVAVFDAGDIGRVRHAGLHRILNEIDQLRFVSTQFLDIVENQLRLIAQLTDLIRTQYGESDDA